jgi:hypothetical protein
MEAVTKAMKKRRIFSLAQAKEVARHEYDEQRNRPPSILVYGKE